MSTFSAAVSAFVDASGQQWGSALAQRALERMKKLGPDATGDELEKGASLLASALAGWPDPEAGQVALTLGMIVEMGASPVPIARTLLGRARATAEGTLAVVRALTETMPEKKDPKASGVFRAALAALEGKLPEATRAAQAFPGVALATIAALSRSREARDEAKRDAGLLEAARLLANAPAPPDQAKFFAKMLHVLDDEDLLVLHPETTRGFDVTIEGVADNFQLHTLLAAELVGRGIPAKAPSPEAVACARGEGEQAWGGNATGAFNLVHWPGIGRDGKLPSGKKAIDAREHWIWNEGVPADIRPFKGRRVVLLGPPPYERSWNNARLFSAMRASVTVRRELDRDEASSWLDRLASEPRPKTPTLMHGGP